MSAIDDARTLVQDIVFPDLKALTARLDALDANMKQRFDAAEKLAETRHELIRNTDPRLNVLEAKQGKVQ